MITKVLLLVYHHIITISITAKLCLLVYQLFYSLLGYCYLLFVLWFAYNGLLLCVFRVLI